MKPAPIAQVVNAAMEALPPGDLRQAVTLREIEGLSYEEIATAMGCPITARCVLEYFERVKPFRPKCVPCSKTSPVNGGEVMQ